MHLQMIRSFCRPLGTLLVVVLLLASGCSRAKGKVNPQEVHRLQTAMQDAFAKKEPQLLLDLYYWEGASDKDRQGTSETVSNLVLAGSLQSVGFAANLSGTEMEVAGGVLRPNLPLVGSMTAEITVGKVRIFNVFPVGETNGRLWIAGGGSFSRKQ